MPQSVIVAATSIRDHFLESVNAALAQLAYRPSPQTASYVVDLLCEFSAPVERDGRPLGLVLAEARQASPDELLAGLKQVGDQSLYLVGYFGDSLRRSTVDPDYYVVIGTSAYRQLRDVLHRRAGGESPLVTVYDELGQEFARFVEVLSEVRSQDTLARAEVADLYDEWLRHGSEAVKRRLQAAGLLVPRRPQRE